LAVPGEGRLEDVSNQPRRFGGCLFTHGTTRPVFEDPDGRQYVEEGGERVYGTWLPPADKPLLTRRSFRTPHHTIRAPGMVGGGSTPAPGTIPLAHHGVKWWSLPKAER
jgi:hypothetical protein